MSQKYLANDLSGPDVDKDRALRELNGVNKTSKVSLSTSRDINSSGLESLAEGD